MASGQPVPFQLASGRLRRVSRKNRKRNGAGTIKNVQRLARLSASGHFLFVPQRPGCPGLILVTKPHKPSGSLWLAWILLLWTSGKLPDQKSELANKTRQVFGGISKALVLTEVIVFKKLLLHKGGIANPKWLCTARKDSPPSPPPLAQSAGYNSE